MTKAIQFILAGAGWKAGKWSLGYQSCDDATAQAGKWDSAKCSANGNAYARNKDVIGVHRNVQLRLRRDHRPDPQPCPGGPVGMVSPANTYTGLTAKGPGTAAGEPGKYYPTGKRNYARVVAQDQYQGAADAILAQRLGVKKMYILNDKEAYGLGVASNSGTPPRSSASRLRASRRSTRRPRATRRSPRRSRTPVSAGVFVGSLVCENGGKLIKDLRTTLGPNVKLILPDGFTPISAVVEGAGAAAENAYVSVAGLPNSKLTGTGQAFLSPSRRRTTRRRIRLGLAAQATVAMLSAIARSNGTRADVTRKIFTTNLKGSITGNLRFNCRAT